MQNIFGAETPRAVHANLGMEREIQISFSRILRAKLIDTRTRADLRFLDWYNWTTGVRADARPSGNPVEALKTWYTLWNTSDKDPDRDGQLRYAVVDTMARSAAAALLEVVDSASLACHRVGPVVDGHGSDPDPRQSTVYREEADRHFAMHLRLEALQRYLQRMEEEGGSQPHDVDLGLVAAGVAALSAVRMWQAAGDENANDNLLGGSLIVSEDMNPSLAMVRDMRHRAGQEWRHAIEGVLRCQPEPAHRNVRVMGHPNWPDASLECFECKGRSFPEWGRDEMIPEKGGWYCQHEETPGSGIEAESRSGRLILRMPAGQSGLLLNWTDVGRDTNGDALEDDQHAGDEARGSAGLRRRVQVAPE